MIWDNKKSCNESRFDKMRKWFGHRNDPNDNDRRPHMPVFAIILMAIGMITVIYLLITYVLIPVLAMMTIS